MHPFRHLLAFLVLTMLGSAASAQNREVPYWASIRAEKINMRVGPSETYPILWVYQRPKLPLKIVRVKEGWRLVEDPDGARGWMVARFLSPDRTVIVKGKDLADMREEPESGAGLLWRVEPGVVGMLGKCAEGWCRIDIDGRTGWMVQDRLWGAGEP